MGAMPNPAQSRLYAGLLPVELSVEALAAHAAEFKFDESERRQPSLGKRASRTIARFLITFYIGVVATLAWQSYSDAARRFIARLSPQLGWLAPQAAGSQTAPEIDEITRNVDRIVATSQKQMVRSVDQLASSQEQMTRTVDQLASSQEQIARELIKLQAISQYSPYKNSEPPRPALAPARNAIQRTSQAR
jgi:methyl-accepting chemotaxis protein